MSRSPGPPDFRDPPTLDQIGEAAGAETETFLRFLDHLARSQRYQAACIEQLDLRMRRQEEAAGLAEFGPELGTRLRALNRELSDLEPGRPAPDLPDTGNGMDAGAPLHAAADEPGPGPGAGSDAPAAAPRGRRPLGPMH